MSRPITIELGVRFPSTLKVDERMSAGRIIGGAFTPLGIFVMVVTSFRPIVARFQPFSVVVHEFHSPPSRKSRVNLE